MTDSGASAQSTGPISLSIIVVSRLRRGHLGFCLMALAAQKRARTEIILVTDPASLDLRPDLAIKRVPFDEANISAARNAGIAVASGEVIAFIDDDALALPGWAERISAPFSDPQVIAATGYTRGPDGFGWQARAERITAAGTTIPVEGVATGLNSDTGIYKCPAKDGAPVSTIGTNCAFRSASLRQIGGFDPAFRYHLDESDVNMRLAQHFPDGLTAIVPQAEVIHGAAAGPVRAQSGVPSDLTQVGRSAAIFARRHGNSALLADAMAGLIVSQRKRLLRLMVSGRLDPFRVGPLLAGLKRGIDRGLETDLPDPPSEPIAPSQSPLLARLDAKAAGRDDQPHCYLSGWHWQAARLRRQAAKAVAEGRITYLALWTPSRLPARLKLAEGGWWEQKSGVFNDLKHRHIGSEQANLAGTRRWNMPIHAAFCRKDIAD